MTNLMASASQNPAPLDHPWEVTVAQARAIQEQLRDRLETRDRIGRVQRVAGIDVAFDKRRGITRAAVALLDLPGLELRARASGEAPTTFPYVPGYLSFREIPAVMRALEALGETPDLLLCDGQGYAHPRRFGLACHLGVLADIPSIGVAKTRLIGSHEPPPVERGAWVPITDAGEIIGAVLRSRAGVKPVFVSVGHRVTLATAIRQVMACTTRYRLPEPARWAHKLAGDRDS